MARPIFRWAASLVVAGIAALSGYLLLAHVINLTDHAPVHIGFGGRERPATNEAGLFFGHADYALQYCCTGSTFLVRNGPDPTDVARGFRVRPTDSRVKGNFRSELRMRPTPVGSTVWYRARVFVPSDWQPSATRVIAMQWHGSKDTFLFEPGKYPPLDLAIVNRRWEITRSWDHRIRTTKTKTGNVEGMALVGGTPMRVGQWAHWVFHVHWSTTDAGRVEAWLDGRKIADVKGPNAHRDLIGPYFKAGVYVPGWGYRGIEQGIRERVLLFDDVDTAYGANPFGLNPSQ